jgi:hypothetical protein
VWLGLQRQGGFDLAEERARDHRAQRAILERIIEDLLHASRIAAGASAPPAALDVRMSSGGGRRRGHAALKGLVPD